MSRSSNSTVHSISTIKTHQTRSINFFIKVYLSYNIMLISGVQHSEEVMLHLQLFKILVIPLSMLTFNTFMPLFPGDSGSEESASMQETQVRSLGQEDPLEKGIATHSSILAWRIPWTEEPGRHSPWGHKDSDITEWLTILLFWSSFLFVCCFLFLLIWKSHIYLLFKF